MLRNRFTLAIASIGCIAAFVMYRADSGVGAQSRDPSSPGRYVMATPPPSPDYAGFLWVLDTQTGEV